MATFEEVQGLYQELLGRDGAPEYVQQFVDMGLTVDEIRNAMMQSQEYQDRQEILSGTGVTTNVDGATNAINLLFQQYGGRAPTQAELDQFLGVYGQVGAMDMANQIQGYFGTGTGTFTDDPTGSQMNPVTAEQVQGLYQNLLGRAGADQYVTQFVNSGMTLDQIRQEMMNSQEYLDLQSIKDGIGNTTNVDAATNAINLLFQQYGGRTPTQAELDQFLGVYGQAGAMDMASQIQGYFASGDPTQVTGSPDDMVYAEFPVTTGQVNQLYMELLGRPGAEQYLSGWVDSGMTLDQIRQEIMKSPEYQALQNPVQPQTPPGGGGTGTITTGQVNQLYMELLGRPGAEQYLSGWVDSGMTLDQIRQAIMESPEYQARQGTTGGGGGGTGTTGGGGGTTGTTGGGGGTTGTTTNPYTAQFEAMQAELAALREQLATLSSMGQPTRGTGGGTGSGTGGGTTGGVYTSAGAYDAQPAFNPYRTQPTPEMLDAYRFQQFQSGAPSLVPAPANQGQGQDPATGYFGYDPRNVQAILSGF